MKGYLTLNGKKRYENPDDNMSFPVNIIYLFTNEEQQISITSAVQGSVNWLDLYWIEIFLFVCLTGITMN